MEYSYRNFPFDEEGRLAALADLAILDTRAEFEFDALTEVVAKTFGVSSSAVSLIDRERQWFKSRQNIDVCQTARDVAFCNHVVESRESMVVLDTLENETFRNNPLVTSDPKIRFYAGAPIFVPSGYCIGSLCVIDGEPRAEFSDADLRLLESFAKLASGLIDARAKRSEADIASRVVAGTPDAILAADRDAKIVYLNAAAEEMFGHSRHDAIGQDVNLIVPARHHTDHRTWLGVAGDGNPLMPKGSFVELEATRADGSTFPAELSLAPWGTEKGVGFIAVIRDITDREKLITERDHAMQFLDTIVTNLPSMLFVKDAATRKYLLVNRRAEVMVGRTSEEMVGKSDSELFPEPGVVFEKNDLKAIAAGRPLRSETKFVRDDGSQVDIRTTRILVDGPDRPKQYLLGLSEDMTEIRTSEQERDRLARYDPLTGLANRGTFLTLVDDLIAESEEFAVLNIDLDRFKAINDQFGHLVGDEVLRVVGRRLALFKGDEFHVARLGADEFACVIAGDNLRNRARRFAEQAIEQITQPIVVRGSSVTVGVSIGIVTHPEDGSSLEVLRQNSDVAMFRAKNENIAGPCFFDDEMDAQERDKRNLERDLRTAIEADQIDVVFQPILHAATQEITSVEALARWTDPAWGPVSPDVFIGIAEDAGLIDQLGEQILRKACIAGLQWPEEIRIAVNLSPRQFYSGKLVSSVLDILKSTGLPSQRLHLEVTENLMISNTEEAFAQLRELQKHGIQISIDDFGIGYSSLSYFQRFSFNKVKIDRSFIAELERSQAAKAIVKAVVGLAGQLSMAVVAEGVETPKQCEMLKQLGCTHLQGYLISPPVPSERIVDFWASPVKAA